MQRKQAIPSPNKAATLRKIAGNLVAMRDVVVPIIGDDIFYVAHETLGHISLHRYLLERFIEEYGDTGLTEESKQIIENGEYYGLSKLERVFRSDFQADHRTYLEEALNKGMIRMDETVESFLRTFRFPLIITTSALNPIERWIMPGNYSSVAYSPKSSNNIVLDSKKPTVYHIFGLIADGRSWVYDEETLLVFLHALHNDDTSSKNLKDYLSSRNCRFLALGCNLPDWLFRFLWYPIKNPETAVNQKNGYWLSHRKTTESFDDFLENIKFYSAGEVNEILSIAIDELQESENNSNDSCEEDNYDFFLSYASEDMDIATQIFDILTAKNAKVWFDKEGPGKVDSGARYMEKLQKGISHSKYYIPVVTGNFLTKALNESSNLRKEIDIAERFFMSLDTKPERYSIPVIVEGSTFKGKTIDSAKIEGIACFDLLPSQLFYQINMPMFRPGDTALDINL